MLIINGTAELMRDNSELIAGTRHEFNMFSKEMPFEKQLTKINGIVSDEEGITHSVLQQAYNKAQAEGFAVTINNTALN